MARAAELVWIVDLLPEIDSDLSVFHRVDDPDALSSSRFIRLAEFLPHYSGAVRNRMLVELRNAGPQQDQQQYQAPTEVPTISGATLAAMTEGPGEFPGIEYTA